MNNTIRIARVSIVELLREKFFLLGFFLGLGLIGLSLILTQLSMNEYDRILADFGFAAIELTAMVLSTFLGAFLLAKEVERQTCLLVLARPVSRLEFILGKMFGVIFLSSCSIFILSGLILVLMNGSKFIGNGFILALSIWSQSIVILGVVMLLGLVVRPVIAIFCGIAVYLLGHWIPDLQFFAKKSENPSFKSIIDVLDWITPNFYRFNWKSFYFLERGFTAPEVLWMMTHCIFWFLSLCFFINLIFRRKDIV